MTTSDPDKNSSYQMPASPLDLSELAKMAVELMSTVPGSAEFVASASDLDAYSKEAFAFLRENRPLFENAISGSLNKIHEAAEMTLSGEGLTDKYFIDSASKSFADRLELANKVADSAFSHSLKAYNAKGRETVDAALRSITPLEFMPVLLPASQTEAGAVEALYPKHAQAMDLSNVKRDFPVLQEKVYGRNIVWLDNAATTQKPQAVIDRLVYFYEHENSNIHRAAHMLAARATDAYEAARESVRRFLNASSKNEIIFVRGATEAINLVAQSWGQKNIGKDDEILITHLEHHANIVPWQILAHEKGARLKVAPVDDSGQVILEQFEKMIGPRTKLVSFTQVSNALGTVTPLLEMIEAAKRHGATVLVDGAQAVSHMPVDMQEYDCDFYVFSGHKVFAPTGIGVLYGKEELLNAMPPWQGGGNMIKDVTFERTLYQDAPLRFEAGTGSIADAVGLAAAIDYLERIGMANIYRHENELIAYAINSLNEIPGLKIIGSNPNKAGALSLVLDGFKTEEVSAALNQQGIAVRAGHHCAQPILRRFGLESTVRPSIALYNDSTDIDALASAIVKLRDGRVGGPI